MRDLQTRFDMSLHTDIAWCPGCGNHMLLMAVKGALDDLGIDPRRLVMVSGIGQAAKAPQYINANMFNGLHGRALPAALGIRLANRNLVVVVESGDGDMYGEGGNHFMHAIRRNFDVTMIIHNNMVYGLTKGQASPTSQTGMRTPVQVKGVVPEPFNPLAVAIALNAPFVARAFAGDVAGTRAIIAEAIRFKGCSVVDVFQPCVIFNKLNTYQWFRENTCSIPDDHNPEERMEAFSLAMQQEPFPLGIFYRNETRALYEDLVGITQTPLYRQPPPQHEAIEKLFDAYRYE